MDITIKEITIRNRKKPLFNNINDELQWFSDALGMFNERDKEKSCFRIFITLLKNKKLTSDEIAEQANLSRGTVIHHINRLMDSGVVVHEKNAYNLRVNRLSNLIDEIENDFEEYFEKMKKVARELDEKLE